MELFKIFGTIALRGKDSFERDVNDATSKGKSLSNALGKGLATAAKVGAAAVGAAASAVGVLTKQSINAFAEYEQLVGGAELLFGDAYDFIAGRAANAYAHVQMSQNEYLQQVNGFAVGLKTALGGNEEAAARLADKIITAQADVVAATGNSQEAVQNAFNGIMKSNFTMLDNLQLGITPTKEGFQEVIDKVNEWNTANGNATKYQIDNLADCQSALVDYIEMQGLAGYAADEAAKTISGSVAMTKAAWSNLLTAFADENADLVDWTYSFLESIENAARRIAPRVVQAISGITTFASQIMPEVVNLIVANLPLLIDAGTQIITALGGAILQNLPLLIATATELVTNLVLYISENVDQFVEAMTQIMLAITSVLLSSAPQMLAAMGELLAQLIISIIEHIPELIVAAAELIAAIIISLQAAVTQFNEVAGEWLNAIIDTIDSWLSNAVEAGGRIVNSIKDGIAAAWGNLVSWFEGLWSSLFSNRTVSVGVSGGVNGSHADGLDYVPFDGYIAQLHKGETVLTAEQARAWRAGKAASSSANASTSAQKSEQPTNITINLTAELDGATVARKLYKYNLLEQRNHGTSLINA